MTENGASRRTSAGIPRIDIRKTVANDVRLMLDRLVPTSTLARLIRNRQTLVADRRAEIRLIYHAINSRHVQSSDPRDREHVAVAAEELAERNSRKVVWLSSEGSILR